MKLLIILFVLIGLVISLKFIGIILGIFLIFTFVCVILKSKEKINSLVKSLKELL